MPENNRTKISVQSEIHVPVNVAWKLWTTAADIMKWNAASDDWHTSKATNDLREGGKFLSRMKAKDGSMGFDFYGVYTAVKTTELIEYTLGDERKVRIEFLSTGNGTRIVETFEAEDTHSIELQQGGWQAILNHFKEYAELNFKSLKNDPTDYTLPVV